MRYVANLSKIPFVLANIGILLLNHIASTNNMKTFSLWDTPVSPDAPSGVDIEYDSRFLELQTAAEGKPEQQYGETIIPAQEPDWSTVEKLCHQLLAESKDMRVLAFYARALTAKYGLAGFAAGCAAIETNLEQFWDTVYPTLNDDDGEYDPFYRINAFSPFFLADGIVKEVLTAHLLTNGLTQQSINVRDAIAVLQGLDSDGYPGGRERLLLDIRVGTDTDKVELQSVRAALLSLEHIQVLIAQKLPEEPSIDFSLLIAPLETIQKAMAYQGNADETNSPVGNTEPAVHTVSNMTLQTTSPIQQADAWRQMNLKNRNDVDLVLEKVCVYFENFEPSHPAPLLLRRVQKFMNMNFYDIMRDIHPDSIAHLEILIGKNESDGE